MNAQDQERFPAVLSQEDIDYMRLSSLEIFVYEFNALKDKIPSLKTLFFKIPSEFIKTIGELLKKKGQ